MTIWEKVRALFVRKKPSVVLGLALGSGGAKGMAHLGALKAFEENGVRVPEDVSVVGFDDMPFAEFSTPPLTTVRVAKEEMGRLAVRILVGRAQSELLSATKTQICTALVERASVCPPRG